MASFYAVNDSVRAQSRAYPKISQQQPPPPPHGFTPQSLQFPVAHTATTGGTNNGYGNIHNCHGKTDAHGTSGDSGGGGGGGGGGGAMHGGTNMKGGLAGSSAARQPTLPPMRRIVKTTVTPTVVTAVVVACALLNTVICIVVPHSATSILGAQWETFVYLWGVVAAIQLVSHSVYLCIPLTVFISVAHFAVVLMTGAMPSHYIYTCLPWLAPCLCTVIFIHQSMLYSLVYSHMRHKWAYITLGAALVLVPMTQLVQIDTVSTETDPTSCTMSAVSIYALYAAAALNSYDTGAETRSRVEIFHTTTRSRRRPTCRYRHQERHQERHQDDRRRCNRNR
ncbi:hypothetical protein T484DRAFT_1755660 [Baffinella frigidus]|nr:hypothetical protein T484DRAFT_1755660 [Cryptophyta sp. CCMP2293]